MCVAPGASPILCCTEYQRTNQTILSQCIIAASCTRAFRRQINNNNWDQQGADVIFKTNAFPSPELHSKTARSAQFSNASCPCGFHVWRIRFWWNNNILIHFSNSDLLTSMCNTGAKYRGRQNGYRGSISSINFQDKTIHLIILYYIHLLYSRKFQVSKDLTHGFDVFSNLIASLEVIGCKYINISTRNVIFENIISWHQTPLYN